MSELAVGDIIDGRYVVERLLGRGGMAAVYLVRHRTLGSFFAVKVLELDRPAIRQRLIKEGAVQSRLRHQNLVGVTDAIEVDGHAALIMEYVHGPNLAERLERGRLPLEQVDSIVANVFDGLEAAHLQAIVHRDLKPHNVMLAIEEKGVIAKIADFGLVKVLDDEGGGGAQTRTGMVFGTPEYMAPEQINDAKSVDARADLFSLGVMLFEMVGGSRPFQGENMMAILARVMTGRRPKLRDIAPDAPERMVAAVERALVVEVDERVQSVAELRELWFHEAVRVAPNWDRQALLAMVPALPNTKDGVQGLAALPRSMVATSEKALNTAVFDAPAPSEPRPAVPVTVMSPSAAGAPVTIMSTPEDREVATPSPVPPPARSMTLPIAGAVVILLLGVSVAGLTVVVGGIGLSSALQADGASPAAPAAIPTPATPTIEAPPPVVTPVVTEPQAVAPAPETKAPEAAPAPVVKATEVKPSAAKPVRVEPPVGGAMPLGRWDGSFGGKVMSLSLEGAPDALIGKTIVTFGSNKITTPVTGHYDGSARAIILDDQLEAADAGRMTLKVGADGKHAEGTWENFSNGTKVKVMAARRD